MSKVTISLISTGVIGNAYGTDLSANGGRVSFTSLSADGSGGALETLFVQDLPTGTRYLVDTAPFSVDVVGAFDFNIRGIDGGALSPDGRYIFYSTGYADGEVGFPASLFVADLQALTTADVTPPLPADASQFSRQGFDPAGISADGRHVLYGWNYYSFGLVPGLDGVFVQDTATGIETAAFVRTDVDNELNLTPLDLTPNGRWATFHTHETTSGADDDRLFRADLQTGALTTIATGLGAFFAGDSGAGTTVNSISDDGRYVAYSKVIFSGGVLSFSLREQVLLWDQTTGVSTVVSTAADGTRGNGASELLALSGDGRHVAFRSFATNLVPNDTNGAADVFVKNLNTGAVKLVTSASLSLFDLVDLTEANVALSFDGGTLMFTTKDNIGSDTDGLADVFVARFKPPTLTINAIASDGYVNAAEKAATVAVSGTSDASGQFVTVTGPNGAVRPFVLVKPDGTWSTNFNLSALADGAFYKFDAAVTDDFGYSTSTIRSFVVDGTPPTLTIGTVAGDDVIGTGEAAAALVTGTSDAIGQSVKVTVDGVAMGVATVTAAGTWSVPINALGLVDGTHAVGATVTDPAGNPRAATKNVLVESTPPALPELRLEEPDVRFEGGDPRETNIQMTAIGGDRFVVTWSVVGFEQVHARVWNDDGTPVGAAFLVPTIRPENFEQTQNDQSVTALANGGFVVVYFSQERFDANPPNFNLVYDVVLRARVFNADGVPLGDDFRLTPRLDNIYDWKPDVVGLADGRFVATWATFENGSAGVKTQIFGLDGQSPNQGFSVGDATFLASGNESYVTSLGGDKYLVTYAAFRTGDTNSYIAARFFDQNGPQGASIAVASGDLGSNFEVAALADGRFLVIWEHQFASSGSSSGNFNEIHARLFRADGTAEGPEFVVAQGDPNGGVRDPSVIALPDRTFALGWTDEVNGESNFHMRLLGPSGLGEDLIVDVPVSDLQGDGRLADLGGGRLAAASMAYTYSGEEGFDQAGIDLAFVKLVDITPPTVRIVSDKTHVVTGETANITFLFSEAITSLDNGDFIVTGGALSDVHFVNERTVAGVFMPAAGVHAATIQLKADAVSDFALNFNTSASLVLGLAIDGYLDGAFVFADANHNSLFDSGEAGAFTDADGSFVLSGASGPLILQGGVDTATRLPFQGTLMAPEGFGIITPITTVIAHAQSANPGMSIDDLVQVVLKQSHEENADNIRLIVANLANSNEHKAQLKLALGIMNAADLAATALVAADTAGVVQKPVAFNAVMAEIADELLTGDIADLGAITQLELQMAIVRVGATLGLTGNALDKIADAAATMIKSFGDAADATTAGLSGVEFLATVSAIALVAQGRAADALRSAVEIVSNPPFFATALAIEQVPTDPLDEPGDPLADVVAQFSGGALLDMIAGAKQRLGDVDGPAFQNAPVALADSHTVAADSALVVEAAGVLENDTDADGDALAAVLASNVSHGTLTLNLDGSFSYMPSPGYSGPDSFAYKANDGNADSNVETVSITVVPANVAPLADDDAYTTAYGTALDIPGLGVLDGDTDANGDLLRVAEIPTGPAHGALEARDDGSFFYTPNAGFSGFDSFTYRAFDGTVFSNLATVSIDVGNPAAGNPPETVDDSYSTDEDEPLTVAAAGVLANDLDANNDALSALLATDPTNGTLTLNADGSFSYTPDANYHGADSFTYKANDGTADGNVATVSIRVNSLNDAPTLANAIAGRNATEDSAFAFTVPANTFADVDVGDSLTLAAALANGAPLPGWLSFNQATGEFSGTPLNSDVGAITVRVTATDGELASVFDDFTLSVANTNDAPTLANAIADRNATEDSALAFTVPANTFADVDVGDSLTLAAALANGAPLPGWLSFNQATGEFSGTPLNSDVGAITVRVTAKDGALASVFDDFVLTVANSNDAPTANPDTGSAGENETKSFNVLGNDTDPDAGDSKTLVSIGAVSVSSLNAAVNGIVAASALSIVGNQIQLNPGTLFDPLNTAETATVVVNYTMADAAGITSSSALTLTINGAAEGPVFNVINGTPGHDRHLNGTAAADQINGFAGNDWIDASGGDDLIVAGAGQDLVQAGGGNDTVMAAINDGNDIYFGESGSDTFDFSQTSAAATVSLGTTVFGLTLNGIGHATSAQFGNDVLFSFENAIGGAGNDTITGDNLENVLRGGAGNDTISGLRGDDQLYGDAGSDRLIGGRGSDWMTGGADADTFVFQLAQSHAGDVDSIAGFVVSQDHLLFQGLSVTALAELDVNGDSVLDTSLTLNDGALVQLLNVSGVSQPDVLL